MTWIVCGAVNWSSTITLGSIIVGALVGAGGLAVFLYGFRWKGAYDVASTQAGELRKALADEHVRGDRLELRLQEALVTIGDQKRTIERLEALPNLERIVNLMAETAKRQDDRASERLRHALGEIRVYSDSRFDAHEERAQERHAAQIGALEAIERRMAR